MRALAIEPCRHRSAGLLAHSPTVARIGKAKYAGRRAALAARIASGVVLAFRHVDEERTSSPINGILFGVAHGTMWGASSNPGEDHETAW